MVGRMRGLGRVGMPRLRIVMAVSTERLSRTVLGER